MAKKTISVGRQSADTDAASITSASDNAGTTEKKPKRDFSDIMESDLSKDVAAIAALFDKADMPDKEDASADQVPCQAGKSSERSGGETFKSAMKRGVIVENPVLRLVLGTCPTLAVTTVASNAIGMGIAATLVLICSNTVISLLRSIIPDKVRIPAYITVIAGFVSIVQMLVKAFAPALDESLGIYLPLIVVNCIILGRAEMYASKHSPALSALDGLAMGSGFTAALLCMGIIREALGEGTLFGVKLPLLSEGGMMQPILFFSLAPGGFFVFGMLMAAANRLSRKKELPVRNGCGDCPAAATCSLSGHAVTGHSPSNHSAAEQGGRNV